MLTPFTSASAEESVIDMVRNSCKKEMVEYCSKVTPGRGRVVACFYAHSDKLGEQCSLAIEVGVVRLNMILSAVDYVVEHCQNDLDTFCGDVEIGSGNMYQCMLKNKEKLAPTCKAAYSRAKEELK